MQKKHTALFAALLVMTAHSALAEAPTSQFGFTGWPYRNTTSCTEEMEDSAVQTCPPLSSTTDAPLATQCPIQDENCPESDTQATAVPTLTPTSTPAQPTAEIPQATRTPQPTQTPSMDDDYTTESVSAQEQKAANLLNQDRTNNGLSALPLDPALCRLARLKSEDMRDNRYFAHQSPTYGSASDMLKQFGYAFSAVGENIAHHATIDKSQAAFMSSDGHRRNILGTSWTKVGVGVCTDANGFVYVTQLFVR